MARNITRKSSSDMSHALTLIAGARPNGAVPATSGLIIAIATNIPTVNAARIRCEGPMPIHQDGNAVNGIRYRLEADPYTYRHTRDLGQGAPMRKGDFWFALCGALIISAISGCGRASNWEQTYEGCKRLASAMTQDNSGMFKAPDCERIQQLCSSDASSSGCKNELANYSSK